MKLGISSFAYGWNVDAGLYHSGMGMSEIDVIREAVNAGLNVVQLGDHLPWNTFSDERISAVQKLAEEHNLIIELGARGLTDENFHRCLAKAITFSTRLLRFIIDDDNFFPDAATVVRMIRRNRHLLEEHNITLAIENHDRLKASALADIVDACDSRYVGICLDCVNSMGAGEGIEHVVKKLSPYTVNLHIKDFTVQRLPHKMGFIVTGEKAGQGMTNIPWIVDEILKHNRCHTAVLEQWVAPEATTDLTLQKEKQWAHESIRYLKSLHFFQSKNNKPINVIL